MLNRIFDMENPVMRALGTICDLLVLNLLAALCCLPVVTAGAAFSALDRVMLRIVRQEEGHVVSGFFLAFRENLRQGSLLGILCLAAAAVFYVDYLAAAAYAPILRVAAVSGALLAGAVALYAFALQSRYVNKLSATLKNAVSLSIAYFPRTLGMLAFTTGLWILCLTFFRQALPVLLMFGFSLPAYFCALFFDGIFQKLEDNPAQDGASRQ